MTRYLELEDALRVVERFGFHVRDAGLLASAFARPATSVMGADDAFELVVGVAAGSIGLEKSALIISGKIVSR